MMALLLMTGLAIGDHESSSPVAQEVMTRTELEPIGRIRVGMTENEVEMVLGEQSSIGVGIGTVYILPYYKSRISVVFCM